MSLNVDFTVNPNAKKRQVMGAQESAPQLLSNALTSNASKGGQFLAGGGNVYDNQSNAGLGTQTGMQNGTNPNIAPPTSNSSWGGYSGTSTTPGGLQGDINENRYGGPGQPVNPRQGASVRSRGQIGQQRVNQQIGQVANNPNATQWNTDYGPVDTGVDNFRQFGDQYYDHTMSRLQPQMEARNAQIAQTLINRGLQPGTEAYAAEMARMDSANNDMMSAAALGAEQLGLQAQNQAFGQSMANNQFGLQQANQNYGQQFGYDQLANAMAIAQRQAAAQQAAASSSAQASMYGADQQNYRAELANALGLSQLNENARQYDIGNITQNQLMDQNYSLGLMGAYNDFQNTGINSYLAQQAGNQNWLGGINSLLGMAPGVGYTGTNTAGQMMQAGNNMANAAANQNQANNSLAGGLMSMFGFSDRGVKKNIEPVGQVHGVNLYEFEYKDHMNIEGRYRGVMADEVRGDYPDAVKNVNGIDMVDYRQLPVNMERV